MYPPPSPLTHGGQCSWVYLCWFIYGFSIMFHWSCDLCQSLDYCVSKTYWISFEIDWFLPNLFQNGLSYSTTFTFPYTFWNNLVCIYKKNLPENLTGIALNLKGNGLLWYSEPSNLWIWYVLPFFHKQCVGVSIEVMDMFCSIFN